VLAATRLPFNEPRQALTTANNMDVKTAIRQGDAEALRVLLTEDASRANALVRWGANDCILTHPLHDVSDMLFDGTLKKGKELPLQSSHSRWETTSESEQQFRRALESNLP
jgi:hypothetical protein